MKGSTVFTSIRRNGLHLGVLPEKAAAINSSTPLVLDHDLDALPDVGRRLTVAELARHVADLANRLWAAGVRPGQHIVVHKSANSDVFFLASAAERIGATPVLLSPALDAETIGALLKRLDQPHLLTDVRKLEALAEVPLAGLTQQVIIVAGSRPETTSLADLAGAAPVEPVLRGADEPEMITHTSGTTGLPKLVVHTPRTMGDRLIPQWRLLSLMRRPETIAIHIS